MKAMLAKLRQCMVALALVQCTAVAIAKADVLRLEGSTTLQPALQELAAGFRRVQPKLELEVRGGGSAQGIRALLQGEVDIASASRFITADEITLAREKDILPVSFRVAHDAIIPIVHKRNPLKSLTLEQLAGIYRGEIDNWRQLGGPDLRIEVVVRDPGSGTFHIWRERVAGEGAMPDLAVLADSSVSVLRYVSDQRGAIGYIGLASLNANVKPLRVDGVMGSLRNVRSGSYPLSRPLFLFTDGWPTGEVLNFINYVLNPDAGQRVIESAGFIPLYRRAGP